MSVEPDLSEFEDISDQRCVVAKSFDGLDEQGRADLTAALDTARISCVRISAWLKKRGLAAHENTVRRHRSGRCCCD